MTRPVFGQTDSPRLAAIKRKWAKASAPKRKPPVPRLVCWDGGGRCYAGCEIAEGCPGPVPNPARVAGGGT